MLQENFLSQRRRSSPHLQLIGSPPPPASCWVSARGLMVRHAVKTCDSAGRRSVLTPAPSVYCFLSGLQSPLQKTDGPSELLDFVIHIVTWPGPGHCGSTPLDEPDRRRIINEVFLKGDRLPPELCVFCVSVAWRRCLLLLWFHSGGHVSHMFSVGVKAPTATSKKLGGVSVTYMFCCSGLLFENLEVLQAEH